MELSEHFLERVRKTSQQELRSRAPQRQPTFLKNLLRSLGYILMAFGVLVSAGFLVVMESTYSQLGVLSNSDVADSLVSSAALEQLLAATGLAWIPTFLALYSIRFLIALGIFGVFALISSAALIYGKSKKDVS